MSKFKKRMTKINKWNHYIHKFKNSKKIKMTNNYCISNNKHHKLRSLLPDLSNLNNNNNYYYKEMKMRILHPKRI